MHSRHWHPRLWLARLVVAVAAVVVALFGVAAAVHAGTYSFTGTIPVTLTGSGVTVDILAGSSADTVDIQATTLRIQVAGGESLTLRYPGPTPGTLNNNAGLTACRNVGGNNDVVVTGPVTVTFTPDSSTQCVASSGGGGGGGGGVSSIAPYAAQSQPNGGETVDVGTAANILWSAGGSQVVSVRLSLSTDGGATYPVIIADNETNDGVYAWTVPDLPTTMARVKIEALVTGGTVGASDASDADFVIRKLPSTIVPAETITEDKNLLPPPEPVQPLCIGGSRIKGPLPAVYYCGMDGKRYVFPNQETYLSWYPDFKGVVLIDAAVLAKIPIGGNITYKPGSLVKVQTDPKVYAVSKGGLLRWIETEDAAVALYGTGWAKLVHDVPDVFFLNYVIGPPIVGP
ncbi:MAG TPA: hypothetical protein VLC10_02350 [Patescibacteria group bacterium]|nr:hypothetical protein [Patescibacteria group bacterium]